LNPVTRKKGRTKEDGGLPFTLFLLVFLSTPSRMKRGFLNSSKAKARPLGPVHVAGGIAQPRFTPLSYPWSQSIQSICTAVIEPTNYQAPNWQS
jgi:hypothetical protein